MYTPLRSQVEAAFGEVGMLMRVLTMRVRPEHLEDWKRYTRDVGFPGMLSQPGCSKIQRMRRLGAEAGEFEVITVGQHRGSRPLQGKQGHAGAERKRSCL